MKAKKLPSGNYRVQVVAGHDENGKRIVKSFTASTEWEALKMAAEFMEDRDNGAMGNHSKNITVRKAMETYVESRSNVIQKTTVRNYNMIIKHNFNCLMDYKLYELTPIDIQYAINTEIKTASAKSVKNAYGLLKSTIKMFSVDVNLNNIILPKVRKKEKELPTFETVYSIIKGTDIELPCLLSVWLSLRVGEVTGLQFKDVDLKNRTLKVRRTIIYTEDGPEVREGCKTEKSVRTLELPNYICSLIRQIPHNRDDEFIVPISRRAIYGRFVGMMHKNDIYITYHDLRHINASVMLMLGIPDKYAMERGGWSTDNILKSVYQQTFSDERKKVDKIIDGYFNSVIKDSDSQNNHTKSHEC